MPDAAELLKLIKKSALEAVNASKPMNFFYGKVIGIKPLVIDVEQKIKLGESQLVLSRNVTDFETDVSIDTITEYALGAHSHSLSCEIREAGEPQHIHDFSRSVGNSDLSHAHKIQKRIKVTVHNGLAVGDKVILLQNKGGQEFLVLDRIG